MHSRLGGTNPQDEEEPSGAEDAPPPTHPGQLLRVPTIEGDDDENDASSRQSGSSGPPHEGGFGLHANATVAQLELSLQLLGRIPESRDATALREALGTVQTMLGEYGEMVRERESWWSAQLRKERQRQSVWEESLRMVVREGEMLENQLKSRSRRRSRLGDGDEGRSMLRMKLRSPGLPEQAEDGDTPTATAVMEDRPSYIEAADVQASAAAAGSPTDELPNPPGTLSPVGGALTPNSSERKGFFSPGNTRYSLRLPSSADDEEADTDDEDQFFDAIDAGALPNLVVAAPLVSREPAVPADLRAMFKGYEKLREKLELSSDNRPPMSLWAVLKGSIGKDLTKISFPVFFNEPTSMLQRMVSEDTLFLQKKK
jgi:hypothetical protein